MGDLMNNIKEIILKAGFSVNMNSKYCDIYKEKNGNCVGCESEDGCNRWVTLGLVMMTSMTYKPQSFEDYEVMNKSIQEKMKKILNPNTKAEEIKALI